MMTVMAMMTTQLPATTELLGVSPGTIAIVLLWLGGLKLVAGSRENMRWNPPPWLTVPELRQQKLAQFAPIPARAEKMDVAIAAAAKPLTSQTEKEWAALDRDAQQHAYWGIYGTRKQSTFFSDRMDFRNCKGDDWPLATHDWGRFCLK